MRKSILNKANAVLEMISKYFKESGISRKDFLIVFILIVNVFAWFAMTPIIIEDIIKSIIINDKQEFIIWASYFFAIIISSIIGSIISNKISRLNIIYSWITLGAATSLVPVLFRSFTLSDTLMVSILLGISFGFGMPSCLSYFAGITQIENRGRISGITLLTAFMIVPLFVIIFGGFDLSIKSLAIAFWRLSALIVIFFKSNKKSVLGEKKEALFSGVLRDKNFGFYILAWLMFCLVDRIGGQIVNISIGDLAEVMTIIGPMIGSVFAFFAGTLSDWVGRKRIILYGFITNGIAYAIIGILPYEPLARYLVFLISSITAGIFFVTFLLIIWGDLSPSGSKQTYYTIGAIPFFATRIIGMVIISNNSQIPEAIIFPVAAFFLFLGVLPLFYVPETLPEKKMEIRRLRKFADDAKKIKEKYERKVV